jgi:hypothetical protein
MRLTDSLDGKLHGELGRTAEATNKCGACERDVFQVPLFDRFPLITILEEQTVPGVSTRGDYLISDAWVSL